MMDLRYISSAGYQLWEGAGTTESGVISGGYIDIEPGFQMISIPVTHGFWDTTSSGHVHTTSIPATVYNYIVQQVEHIYGVPGEDMIEVFNTLIGGSPIYFNFQVGVTNPLDTHNFKLAYYDSEADDYEYTGFFIKSIHSSSFRIQWGEI